MKYDHSSRQSRLALQAKVIMTLANAGFDEGADHTALAMGAHWTSSRNIPQSGQRPGSSWMTSGCIGQVY